MCQEGGVPLRVMAPSREATEALHHTAWVTYSVALLCVLGFAYAQLSRIEADTVIDAGLESAEQYFTQHPYLQPPSILELRIPREQSDAMAEKYEANRRRRHSIRVPAGIRAREQAEIDRMLEASVAQLQSLPERRWGVRADQPAPWSFATHVFFHSTGMHLLIGLFLVVFIGYFLEGLWGSAIQLGVVLAATLGAAGLFVSQNASLSDPYIGTLGLAAGFSGAFAIRFGGRRRDVPYYFVLVSSIALLALPAWFGFEWSIPRGPFSDVDGLGHGNPTSWALLGGFVAGGFVSCGLTLFGIGSGVERDEANAQFRRSQTDRRYERALQEHALGNVDEAFNILISILRRDPENIDACIAFWSVANDLGRPGAASKSILRVIRDQIQRRDMAAAVRYWLELVACGLAADAESSLSIRMATLLRSEGHEETAMQALRNALAGADGANLMTIATRVAHEAADLEPQLARDAIWKALGSHELGLEDRQDMESLLSVIQPLLDPDDHPEPASSPLDAQDDSLEPEAAVSAADLLSPGEAEAELGQTDRQPAAIECTDTQPRPIEFDDSSRGLESIVAIPTEFDAEGLMIELEGGKKKRIRFDRIEAVAVAAIDGLGDRPVIVIDLILNWMSLTDELLRVIRLRGDRFDPRRMMEGDTDPLQAMRAFIVHLVEKTDATPLPDLQSVRGMPFASFSNLLSYHRDILMVELEDDKTC